MAEQKSGKARRRRLAANGGGERWTTWLRSVNYKATFLGVGSAFVLSLLLIDYQFQSLPDYETGDIADRTIEAPSDFTLVDSEATDRIRQESLREVPAVFDLDQRRNTRVETELRSGFAEGRRLIGQFRQRNELEPEAPLSAAQRQELLQELLNVLPPSFNRPPVLAILLRQGFSTDLEGQMVRMLQQAMKPPGVAASRDMLVIYQDRGIVLQNTITGQERLINDWTAIRDQAQAKDLLRQNEYLLTAVGGEDKRQLIDFLDGWVVPNVDFNEADTRAREELAMANEGPVLIQIKRGRTLIRAGDEVTPQHLALLGELKKLEQTRQPIDRFFGIFALASFFLFALWTYFQIEKQKGTRPLKRYSLVALILLFNVALAKVLVFMAGLVAASLALESLQNPLYFEYGIPLAMGSILVILLIDTPTCVLYTLVFSVFASLLTRELAMGIYPLVGGLAALMMLRQYRERSAIVRAGLVIGLANLGTAVSLLLFDSGFDWVVAGVIAGAALSSGLLSAMFAAILLPVLESLFDITTDVRLLELSDLNKPILRRLAMEAPGTYNHSLVVSNLAEAAAEAIGANALLVRVGAYYHDIGKMLKPEYFVENQHFVANKHENLSPNMSSIILASHVKDGLAMAEEMGLSRKVRDLIPQHHGTKLMTYFYQKAKQSAEGKNVEVNEEDFRYPGPKPQTREAAILMLADQVEAASRTLRDPSPGRIRGMIRRLIQGTIEDRQFDECDITTSDLNLITRAFERFITGKSHQRIEYPGFDFNRQQQVEQISTGNQRIQ